MCINKNIKFIFKHNKIKQKQNRGIKQLSSNSLQNANI